MEWIKTMQMITLVVGLVLSVIGVGVILYGYFRNTVSLPGNQLSLYSIFPPPFVWLFWGVGLVAIGFGIYLLWRSTRPDIIRKQLINMKPAAMKRNTLIMFAGAIFFISFEIVTKQVNQIGVGSLWILAGLASWWQGSHAEQYRALQ